MTLLDGLLFSLSLTAGISALALAACRSRAARVAAMALLCAVSALGAWAAIGLRESVVVEEEIDDRPVRSLVPGYTSSNTCQSCHPEHYETWHRSFHRTMTQVPTPENVLGPFDVDLSYRGRHFRYEQRGDQFWFVESRGDGEAPIERPVVLMTGSHHFQVYWYRTDQEELATLPFVFDIAEQQWIPSDAGFVTPPSEEIHDDRGQWSRNCIRCHTTHGRPGLQPSGAFEAEVVEFGIACEACHGPASEHVRINSDPLRRYRLHLGEEHDESTVQPEHLTSIRSSQVCGQCHSINEHHTYPEMLAFFRNGYRYRPGDDLTQTRLMFQVAALPSNPRLEKIAREEPLWMRGTFWADGMVRVTGREYSALIETPCYTHGDERRGILSCLSCHTMHQDPEDPRSSAEWRNDQLIPGMEGDPACLQCHTDYTTPEALTAHTHHKADSTGSRCYNCHMPYTTYGLLKAVRSHLIDSPTVQASLKTGRPNACNQCHLDKTLAWTMESLEQWYETPRPELTEDERHVAASLLWLLRGDAGQRALMAWTLGWESALQASGSQWAPIYLASLLNDPYEAVRYIAYRSLREFEGYEELEFDITADRMGRLTAGRHATEIWMRHVAAAEEFQTGEAILIDSRRRLRLKAIDRLLRQRDDIPITLQE